MLAIISLAALLGAADTTYFQQRVHYRIEARLDEPAQLLDARMRMSYHNNAPAALDTLWFHLHLNAFRPNSAWARRDLQFGDRRFQDLGPDAHAFERVSRISVNGVAVQPVYPLSPDSTVMAVPLPRRLAAGDSTVVEMDWQARPSTTPRRQGRRGRHYDFAQWYPRIAVYDRDGWQVQPLLPQGEFYGEFGSFDVTLDVAADQVVGATGVPVEGDPGWARAAAMLGTVPALRRDAYPARAARPLGLVTGNAAAQRKRIRWRAEDVHHFAWTTSPDYIYEGGSFEDVAIHVLYQPADTATWGRGIAVQRTVAALAAFDTIFGDFAWPQITNVHRIEGGGTEFPMMVMNGSASEGLILHEAGHNYTHGILANNEWREGWLDEGFVSYLTNWAHELAGRRADWTGSYQSIREMEREGTQPISLPSASFSDPGMYGAMTYTKPSIVFRMLHWLMGDAAFRAGMRRFYADNRLQHVREADLLAAVNAVSAEPLDWFFRQWIHTTDTLDYRVGNVAAQQRADGQWTVTVEVLREGGIYMPVDLQVGAMTQRLTSRERRQVVEVTTSQLPQEVVLDPLGILLDMEPRNNRRPVTR